MFIELIEALRCPRHDEDSALVAAAERTESRHILDGVLGCPVCGAEFRIAKGIAYFDEPRTPTRHESADAETGMRVAAFLELTDARSFAVLCGRWGAQLDFLLRLTQTPLVLLNPPPDTPVDAAAGVLITRDVAPFAADSVRAAALDAGNDPLAASMIRAVRPRGRMIGPESLRVSGGVTEIARDARMWVGEKAAAPDGEGTPRLVPLKRAR